ncbi:MAG TPA: DUF4126 domain-containing protein [Terrimesophilobacter sp.]|nr:DUF4126 domain-containing protein [Terrimesophilobacter sp.]
MLEFLTGAGLALSAGLNAYVPLLVVGLAGRFTELMTLPEGWSWLSNDWVLIILGVLLLVEVVADKVPVVDHVNDVLQSVVRPVAGGLAFGSGSASETVAVTDPAEFFASNQWVPIAVGVVLALAVHLTKAFSRATVNAATVGTAAPLVSTAEDVGSVGLSFAALVVPVLVVVALIGFVWLVVWLLSRRRRRTRTSAAT